MPERIRIAVVGGGRTGAPLIENLIEIPYVDLVGVADVDPECHGAILAEEHGIPFTQDALSLVSRGDEIDAIIEVSGDPALKPALKKAFIEGGNTTTIILTDLIARFVLSIATGRNELAHTYHPDDRGIGGSVTE